MGFYKFVNEFYEEAMKSTKNTFRKQIVNRKEFYEIRNRVQSLISNNFKHPKLNKLEEVVVNHFKDLNGEQSRVIVFAQYIITIEEIVKCLSKHNILKVMSFVGFN
jgi:ERCC4-related helicase